MRRDELGNEAADGQTSHSSQSRRGRDGGGPCPEQIGGYAIVRRLGAGASAVVYEARQRSPERPVALKVLRQAAATRTARRRFELEAEVLGRLRHPGIAAIHAAGVHRDGPDALPFLVTELVLAAQPITDYASASALSRDERVALFARVCEAVAHGHQRGIVHRDLKPGNILVDAEGRPKVIDFGVSAIAGAGDDGVTDDRLVVSGGTIQYMSPERCAEAATIDPRSDVYALGVILHELLAGSPPIDVRGLTPVAAQRSIIASMPTPLRRIDPATPRDLEAIVLKALDRQPRQRYRNAAELGDDLRRYLAGASVVARPWGVLETLVRLVRGHPVATTACLALLVTLLATTIAAAVLFRTTETARVTALRAERQSLELATDLWSSAREAHLATLGADPLAADEVERALEAARHATAAVAAGDDDATQRLLDAVGLLEGAARRHEQRLDERLDRAEDLRRTGRFEAADTLLAEVGRFRNVDERRRRLYVEWIAGLQHRVLRDEAREAADRGVAAFPDDPAIAACAAETRMLFLDMARVEPPPSTGPALEVSTMPITQGQFVALLGRNPARLVGWPDRLLTRVSWYDAVLFCNTLSEREGRRPRYEIERLTWSPQASIANATVRRVDGDGYRLPRVDEWRHLAINAAETLTLLDRPEWCDDDVPSQGADAAALARPLLEQDDAPPPMGTRKGGRFYDVSFRVVREGGPP